MPRGRNPIVRETVESAFNHNLNASNETILRVALNEARGVSTNPNSITPTLINNMYYNWCGRRLYMPRSYRRQQQRQAIRTTQTSGRGRPRNTKISPTKTFGIEIEFINNQFTGSAIARTLTNNGIPTNYESYNHYRRNHWKIVTDASVPGGLELVSPVLKGESGLEQIEQATKILEQMGCKVNHKCGLHVHHKVKKTHENRDENAKRILKNCIELYAEHQNDFNDMLPQSRTDNQYCRNTNDLRTTMHTHGLDYIMRNSFHYRYYAVNVCSYLRHGTVEFRQHSGTIEFEKIKNWILITQKIVERAEKFDQLTNYTTSKSIVHDFRLDSEIANYIATRTAKFSRIANRRAA